MTGLLGVAAWAGSGGLAWGADADHTVRVGRSEFTSAQGLPITLVYPTTQAEAPYRQGVFQIRVAENAPLTAGAHRLIVISHGAGGSAIADHDLAATLARAGFVVAQPLHRGDNWSDTSRSGPKAWVTRREEISETIDALAAHPRWGSQVLTHSVGVHGMSAGGVSALGSAGGQWNLLTLARHCATHLQADIAFCHNGTRTASEREQRERQFALARFMPDALAPSELKTLHGGRTPDRAQDDPRPDARVAAVSLAVPLTVVFTRESLARIRIPVGVVRAGQDQVLLPQFHSDALLAQCTACRPLADLARGGHFDVLSPWPESVAVAAAQKEIRGGALSGQVSEAERTRMRQAVLAFFEQHLQRAQTAVQTSTQSQSRAQGQGSVPK